ncbi:MAG: hypothetical protein NZ602_14970 [Thermoguttaceae bacterium]|nr:hypothetical protein [Thermoguttaceae bacterium]MDW8037470.1 hypothetical protein [Thermoguttaceae bacterium]
MKGIQGLILALGLGIAGALFNWAYLHQKSLEQAMVLFVGINPNVTVNAGDKLSEDHLVPVAIPAGSVGNLKDFAYLWESRSSLVGRPVYRTLTGGSLVLREDLKTPPPELVFGENLPPGEEERVLWVPVASNSFVPSLVSPGDMVDFVVSYGGPTPAYVSSGSSSSSSSSEEGSSEEESGQPSPKPAPSSSIRTAKGNIEVLGPFKILSLGNRLSSWEVWQAWGKQPANENVLGVSVRLKNGQLEPKAQRLIALLQETGFRNVTVMLRPRDKKSR